MFIIQLSANSTLTILCEQHQYHSDCSIEENTMYSGHNLYTTKGIKVGNKAGCASLCFNDNKCKFWTYNPRWAKHFSSCQLLPQSVQVLDEDLEPGKENHNKGFNLRTESVWGSRWFRIKTWVSSRCFTGRTREPSNKWKSKFSKLPIKLPERSSREENYQSCQRQCHQNPLHWFRGGEGTQWGWHWLPWYYWRRWHFFGTFRSKTLCYL